MVNMNPITWMIIMAMAACFRAGVNTDVIPYETQKDYIYNYVFEIIEEGEYDVHPALILAIVETESTYYWQAKNGEHYGLMQINPKWQKDRMERLEIEDLSANPYDNLRVGIDYIQELLHTYKNEYTALNVYNSGSTHDGYATSYSITVMDKKLRIEHEMWDKMEGW